MTSFLIQVLFWLGFFLGLSHAEPYAEYRNDLKFNTPYFDQGINYLRFGYKFDNDVYLEVGPRTDGVSAEIRYKRQFFDEWLLKSKWEASEIDDLEHKLETELRLSISQLGGTYVEYKSEVKYKNADFDQNVDHLRLGYKFGNNFYLEIGPRTNGTSGEVGYKYRFSDNWSFKGKWEGHDTNCLEHKIETEFRYRF